MKIRLKQIAQDGATDGQSIVWDNAAGVWAPASSLGGGSLQALTYAFSTLTAAANPGAGTVRFNSATYAAIDKVFVNDIANAPTLDIGSGISSLVEGDLLSFAQLGAATSAVVLRFVSAVDNGGWWTITVTHVDDAGGPIIADGADTRVSSILIADHFKNNLTATVNPTVNDDDTLGYAVGSRWVNTTVDEEYTMVRSTTGAALWKRTTVGVGAGQGVSAEWRFNTSTSPGPSTGRFRTNDAVLANVTEIYVNDIANDPSLDHGFIFGLIADGDHVFVQENGDSTSSAIYRITSTTDNTGDWTFVVTFVEDGGGDNFGNNTRCTLAFIRLAVRHNPDANTDPSVSNDSTERYGPLSQWINAVTDEAFICLDSAVGAAAWKTLTGVAAHTHAHSDTTGQTADDHHNQSHAIGGSDHTASTFAELDALVSDADLVAGPATSADTNLAAFDGVTGQLLQDSGISTALALRLGTQSGVLTGCEVTADGAAAFAVASGTVMTWDWSTGVPVVAGPVPFAGAAGVSPAGLATDKFTGLYINSSGLLVQIPGAIPTPNQRRSNAVLQVVAHADNVNITDISDSSVPAYDVTQAILDYIEVNGPLNRGTSSPLHLTTGRSRKLLVALRSHLLIVP